MQDWQELLQHALQVLSAMNVAQPGADSKVVCYSYWRLAVKQHHASQGAAKWRKAMASSVPELLLVHGQVLLFATCMQPAPPLWP